MLDGGRSVRPHFDPSVEVRNMQFPSGPGGATVDAPLILEDIPALKREVRALAEERNAVILAHNYQVPEVQDVADYVGDSLGLSRRAAAAGADVIAFCGVHFMADIARVREDHPGAEFLIHPECGCSTSVMEYVAAGDVDPERTHMLSTSGMLKFAAQSDAETFIVATETGMLHPLEQENPGKEFVPANRAAVCQYMKMITLPKLRDALRDGGPAYTVKVDPEIAARARVPIERMVAI